jgi:hypothetical protein
LEYVLLLGQGFQGDVKGTPAAIIRYYPVGFPPPQSPVFGTIEDVQKGLVPDISQGKSGLGIVIATGAEGNRAVGENLEGDQGNQTLLVVNSLGEPLGLPG